MKKRGDNKQFRFRKHRVGKQITTPQADTSGDQGWEGVY